MVQAYHDWQIVEMECQLRILGKRIQVLEGERFNIAQQSQQIWATASYLYWPGSCGAKVLAPWLSNPPLSFALTWTRLKMIEFYFPTPDWLDYILPGLDRNNLSSLFTSPKLMFQFTTDLHVYGLQWSNNIIQYANHGYIDSIGSVWEWKHAFHQDVNVSWNSYKKTVLYIGKTYLVPHLPAIKSPTRPHPKNIL